MRKSEKAFCVICLAILMFFFGTIVVRTVTRQVLIKHFGIRNTFTDVVFFDANDLNNNLNDGNNAVDREDSSKSENDEQKAVSMRIDWAALYPFSEEILAEQAQEAAASEESDADQPRSKIAVLQDKVGTYTSDYLFGYHKMTELAKGYEHIMQWNYVPYAEYNGIIRTNDNYLTTLTARLDIQPCADAAKALSDFCAANGIDFLYINAPKKICKINDSNISGVSDFSNQNADDFMAALQKSGVACYDLRDTLHNEGLDHHSLFYRTDHHWHPETGLWASSKIASELNDRYNYAFDLSYVDPAQYKSVIYPEWFLGSQGKKVTLSNADPEDFTLLYPNFNTLLHYQVKSKCIDALGDFSIMYDMDCVTERDYYEKNPYGAYIYADQPLEIIENTNLSNGKHLLFVHDSFGNCVVPFLAMGIQRVDSIDLRLFDGSLQTYIEAERPDTVIVMYHSGVPGTSVTDGGLFDFR